MWLRSGLGAAGRGGAPLDWSRYSQDDLSRRPLRDPIAAALDRVLATCVAICRGAIRQRECAID